MSSSRGRPGKQLEQGLCDQQSPFMPVCAELCWSVPDWVCLCRARLGWPEKVQTVTGFFPAAAKSRDVKARLAQSTEVPRVGPTD
ncbi:unnamed protein product [Protopolystoma xenopodis]|uniref:Uncharacterized protein n=1 Tax=Protopolystoma xenopodis TaxID=117903 RepID=A0A448XTB0_9PLAT|nr:unnamed protein product [Protopolystoma xenopodis]